MCIHGGIPRCARQIFTISVRNVLTCFWVPKSFGEPKVDNINVMLLFADADQKVVRFDVSVQKVTRVDELVPLQHLVGEHQDCLEGEFTFTVVEQVLQAGTQQIDDHHVIITFDSEPVDVGNANASLQYSV